MGISKERKNFGWTLALIFGGYLIINALIMLVASPDSAIMESMQTVGMVGSVGTIAVLEVIGAILLMIPRTASLGTLFLTAFFGGAIAANVTQGQSFVMPLIMLIIVLSIARIKNPEMYQSLRKG